MIQPKQPIIVIDGMIQIQIIYKKSKKKEKKSEFVKLLIVLVCCKFIFSVFRVNFVVVINFDDFGV